MAEQMCLQDKVIIITGASSGLGRQLALAYTSSGASVVLLGRNVKTLEQIYDEVTALDKAEPFAVTLDLFTAGEFEFEQLAMAVEREAGRLDGIVHCAGYFYALSPLINQSIDEWMNQYRINAVAPMALTRACLPLLQRAEDASVIFVGENHAENPKAYWGGFGASYAAVNYLCQVAADEWSTEANLRVNVIEPGAIHSPLRMKTHPGESVSERKKIAAILPDFIYWMSTESAGKTGNIIKL